MSVKIAKAQPFCGAPVIHMPSVYGAATGKEMRCKIPVTGQRPIRIRAEGLWEGLTLKDGILSGCVEENTEFSIVITAENEQGKMHKRVLIKVQPDGVLLTPLLGFTSWNAYASKVTQKKMEETAKLLMEKGIADYGYRYINVDSGWQKEYGGKFNAVMPNEKFPDMEGMCRRLHEKGFLCGIYSTPMLTAWGCPEEFDSIPGCTVGEPDILCTSTMGGIGLEHRESNNVRQWEKWGFDYLKYDWYPVDAPTADRMKQELLKSKRAFGYCVTVRAGVSYANYWKKNCSSWRDNNDSTDSWDNIKERMGTVDCWADHVNPGHFYDLDMLETGAMEQNGGSTRLTENEALFAYTMRAFFLSPIQLSCQIEKLTEFELDMICNDEILALNQDSLAMYPRLLYRSPEHNLLVYKRGLENGDCAIAAFNLEEAEVTEHLLFDETRKIRDIWEKKNLAEDNVLNFTVEPHGVRVFRISGQSLK